MMCGVSTRGVSSAPRDRLKNVFLAICMLLIGENSARTNFARGIAMMWAMFFAENIPILCIKFEKDPTVNGFFSRQNSPREEEISNF